MWLLIAEARSGPQQRFVSVGCCPAHGNDFTSFAFVCVLSQHLPLVPGLPLALSAGTPGPRLVAQRATLQVLLQDKSHAVLSSVSHTPVSLVNSKSKLAATDQLSCSWCFLCAAFH